MANTTSDFVELLSAETHVDIDKVRSAARHGIPNEVRGEVWKYLLGVEVPDKTDELSRRQAKQDEYRLLRQQQGSPTSGSATSSSSSNRLVTPSFHSSAFPDTSLKRVRGEISRYYKARSKFLAASPQFEKRLEEVLVAFLEHQRTVEYSPELVYLCGPLVALYRREGDAFFGFLGLMTAIEDHYSTVTMNARLSDFLMLFGILLPDLHNHFEEEEVEFKECASSWFRHFLAKELPLECLLRLWDTYFSIPVGLGLHVFVCLAILSSLKDSLEDLEQSEIHAVLLRLPSLDMDKIVNQALSFRDEVVERNLSDLVDQVAR
ncbi:rab-GTPase-TBC domain-containing protein [Zopfochytrium polystomum]|nr:rab-GTPase-TBC domain-containing protein [Zopfochytrium polystomum]